MASKAIGFLNFKFGADLKGFDRAMKKAQKNLLLNSYRELVFYTIN